MLCMINTTKATAGTDSREDTRFFPGHVWCSDCDHCRIGLCAPKGLDERAAADWYAPNRWDLQGRTFTVYTKTAAYDVPQRHLITR